MEFLADNQSLIAGMIFMLVLGAAVGNYACSVVYRLPLGKTPFERHPFCSHCNVDLQTKDLFPIFSWLSTKGKCRYCGGEIPGIYTVIEIACAAIFMLYFWTFGISEEFILYTAYAVFVVILAAIQWQQGWISSSIYGYALTFGVLARTLDEGTIYGWVKSFFITMVVCLMISKIMQRKNFHPFETNWIWWVCLIAAATPLASVECY